MSKKTIEPKAARNELCSRRLKGLDEDDVNESPMGILKDAGEWNCGSLWRWPGEAEELGGRAIYSASAASRYVTGPTIVVDGRHLAEGIWGETFTVRNESLEALSLRRSLVLPCPRRAL